MNTLYNVISHEIVVWILFGFFVAKNFVTQASNLEIMATLDPWFLFPSGHKIFIRSGSSQPHLKIIIFYITLAYPMKSFVLESSILLNFNC